MVTALLQIPTREFRAKVDTKERGDDGSEGKTKLEPPSDPPNFLQDQTGAKPKEDAESDPHPLTHHEGASNRSGDIFGGKNGNHGRSSIHTEAERQAADEKSFPGLAETGADDRVEDGAEDGTATPEVKVEYEWSESK